MTTKKIGVNELKAIVKEAIAEKRKGAAKPSPSKVSESDLRTLVRESVSKQISEMMEPPKGVGTTFEKHLADPVWGAREFGLSDISGSTPAERATDIAYQLGWNRGHTGKSSGATNNFLRWASKQKWGGGILVDFNNGKKDGSESGSKSNANPLKEMMASDTAKPKVVVPRPQMSASEPEVTGSRTPQEGDKVQLASGKEAWVAKVSGDMVFVTIDGIKMVGVPSEYVSVLDDSSGFNASSPAPEDDDTRAAHLDKLLDRPFMAKTTSQPLEKERGGIEAKRQHEKELIAAAREKAMKDEEEKIASTMDKPVVTESMDGGGGNEAAKQSAYKMLGLWLKSVSNISDELESSNLMNSSMGNSERIKMQKALENAKMKARQCLEEYISLSNPSN